jgi:two-component system, OmpR family, sensor histidine kinase VicK
LTRLGEGDELALPITEVIRNQKAVETLFIEMVKAAEQEILLIFPTANSFLREERLGIIHLLRYGAIERSIDIKILTPTDGEVQKIIQDIVEETRKLSKKNFHIRSVGVTYEETTVSTVTIIIVDKKTSLAIEKIDDSKENFIDAIGLATYSNSKPTVSSYVSIFEILWNQTKLYEELRNHDKMQQEFINIAAHELRTPAQSILGYAELAKSDPQYMEKDGQSFLEVIYRNAFRIHKLTKDILDVTRIEGHTLNLDKIRFNLNDLIKSLVYDKQPKLVADSSNNKVEVVYRLLEDREVGDVENNVDTVFVQADRDRIAQVISNLLDNAFKFTHQGLVSIGVSIKENKQGQEGENQNEVVVSIEDSGSGIDPEIFPRLFTKFSSKSFSGTGLGLYISKSIIEAHGGKIWAKNNNEQNKPGATFSFTLPLAAT